MELLRRLIRRLTGGQPPVEDPNDIGTGTDDIYLMSLVDILNRLDPDDEDDTDNFYLMEELIDN